MRVQQLQEVIESINGAPPEAQNVAIPVNVQDEGTVGVEHVVFEEAEGNFTESVS